LFASGLYVEFSDVRWADHVWVLLSDREGGGQYASIRHNTDDHCIPKGLHLKLVEINGL